MLLHKCAPSSVRAYSENTCYARYNPRTTPEAASPDHDSRHAGALRAVHFGFKSRYSGMHGFGTSFPPQTAFCRHAPGRVAHDRLGPAGSQITPSWRTLSPRGAATYLAPTATSTTTSPSPCRLTRCSGAIDKLGELGTSIITQSGGEPLLHPELDQIIARVRKTGAIAGMITNGYLLTADRIRQPQSRRPAAPADQHRQRHAG